MEIPNIVSWSGGKDSTASIIIAHQRGLRIDLIISTFVWFDKERGILGENPIKVNWMMNYAAPIFESWGYPVKFLYGDNDYYYYFFKVRQKSKHPENIGKYYGFLMGGACCMQKEKVNPIKRYIRDHYKDYCEIVGICSDEKDRIQKMIARKRQRSLLDENSITQEQAREICIENQLLCPTYTSDKNRDGCWFCPNQKIPEMAELKTQHPELWDELRYLSTVPNTIARGFKYGVPFDEIEKKVDEYIKNPPPKQLSLFDIITIRGERGDLP